MGAPYIYDISRLRVKNTGSETPGSVIFQAASSRIQTSMRKFNLLRTLSIYG